MSTTPSTSASSAAPALSRGWALESPGDLRLAAWLARRPVRILLLLSAVWLLNGFDLLFTILAVKLGSFIELNPVAASILNSRSFAALGMYKGALVVIGSCLLWRCRHHRLSEVGCWMMFLLYSGLAWRWLRFYQVWSYYSHGGEMPAECDEL